MQCNCKQEMEAKLEEHVKAELPAGFEDFKASLSGYTFTLGASVESRFYSVYSGEVMVPKAKGDGMKRQKINTNFMAMYCPWCGKKATAEEAA